VLAPKLYGTIAFGQSFGGVVISKLIKFKFDKYALAYVVWLRSLICLLFVLPVMAQMPIVSEYKLENGIRVLLAPRPGCGAIHAAWFIEGGRWDTGDCPPEAADLLLAAWFADFSPSGASGKWMKAGAGGISSGRDIAAESLEAWCNAEMSRIRQVLGQEQIDSARRFLQSQWQEPDPMAELYAMTLSENNRTAYEPKNIASLASISIADLQTLAGKYVTADRVLIVLVGDVKDAPAMSILNTYFGSLEPSNAQHPKNIASFACDACFTAGKAHLQASRGQDLQANPDIERSTFSKLNYSIDTPQNNASAQQSPWERKKEILSKTRTEVMVAWPIPFSPKNNNKPSLELFAEIITGSPNSELTRRLVTELGCSNSVQTLVGVSRYGTDLFVIRADVAEGHTTHEVENAIQSEVQRSLRYRLQDADINRAAQRLETKHALRLADASGLAQALIDAIESGGDWGLAVVRPLGGFSLEIQVLTSVLRFVFQPDSSFSLLLEQDPIRSPRSHEEARLVSLLVRLLENRVSDPAQRESIIRETVRQFRQTPREKRGQLFSLLEARIGH